MFFLPFMKNYSFIKDWHHGNFDSFYLYFTHLFFFLIFFLQTPCFFNIYIYIFVA